MSSFGKDEKDCLQLFKGCNLGLSSAVVFPTYTVRAEFQAMFVAFEALFQCFTDMSGDCKNVGQN
jgi:hypothetical protein